MKRTNKKNQNSEMLHNNISQENKKAFTLVELIIVITILAVLATIAFVSFSSYTASSRDTKRLVTIESIEKGLNIFQTQTGKYPNIDNQSSTGIINSDTLSFVGEVGDNVSRLINITPTPKDPVSGNNYVYATSFDQKYFQVAGTQEKPVAAKSIFSQAYANSRQAKVLGNYNGLLKKDNKLYNLPSLIYTGSGYLISNSTYFIIDKGQNIPYKIASTDPDNSIATSAILTQLTGTSSVSLTGVTLPATVGELKTNINSVVQILGYPGDKIGQEIFGTQYFVNNGGSGGGAVSVPLEKKELEWIAYFTANGCSPNSLNGDGTYYLNPGVTGPSLSPGSSLIGNNEPGYPGGKIGIDYYWSIVLPNQRFTNLDFLTGIKHILGIQFYLQNNLLTNIDGLSSFIGAGVTGNNMLELDLSNNLLTNVNGLTNLKFTNYLNISNNQLTNLNGLIGLNRVGQNLTLNNNQISDISGLTNLLSVSGSLDLSYNQLTNINGLSNLKFAKRLYLNNNQLTNVNGLSEYQSYFLTLELRNNNISDYRGLSKLSGIPPGTTFDDNPSAIFPGPGTTWCTYKANTADILAPANMKARAQGYCDGSIQ